MCSQCADNECCAAGDISVNVSGPEPAEVTCVECDYGVTQVTYTPTVPGRYDIHVSVDGVPVQGSPFNASIMAAGWSSEG